MMSHRNILASIINFQSLTTTIMNLSAACSSLQATLSKSGKFNDNLQKWQFLHYVTRSVRVVWKTRKKCDNDNLSASSCSVWANDVRAKLGKSVMTASIRCNARCNDCQWRYFARKFDNFHFWCNFGRMQIIFRLPSRIRVLPSMISSSHTLSLFLSWTFTFT